MAAYMKEFDFTCEDTIDYHANGELIKTNNLLLKAPNMMSRYAALISQDIMIAIKSSVDFSKTDTQQIQKQQDQVQQELPKKEDDKIEIDTKGVLFLLYSAKTLDMEKFKEKFMGLLLERNVCFLDSQIPITKNHFSFISHREFNRLMGEYISNFLIP